MNRVIKFRGLRRDGRSWVYGDLIQLDDRIFIAGVDQDGYVDTITHVTLGYREVIPESVGQFTGLFDINGKEIYEGDFITSVIKTNGYVIDHSSFAEFKYSAEGAAFLISYVFAGLIHNVLPRFLRNIEVIGNIHQKEVSHE